MFSPKCMSNLGRLTVQFFFFLNIFSGDFYSFCSYNIQHCFICRPSDSTVPTDAGIEPRTVATGALAVRRSNHQARSHPPLGQISSALGQISLQCIEQVRIFNLSTNFFSKLDKLENRYSTVQLWTTFYRLFFLDRLSIYRYSNMYWVWSKKSLFHFFIKVSVAKVFRSFYRLLVQYMLQQQCSVINI